MNHLAALKLIFLGTGASGGTLGKGKSKRFESSLLISNKLNILIDITRFFSRQSQNLNSIDYILLTHGHKDACGGINQLKKPTSIYAHKKTIAVIKNSFSQLGHCRFKEIKDNQSFNLGNLKITPCKVPHSNDVRFPAFAWKIAGKKTIVYASDVAELTSRFKSFCKGVDLLIVDGATWKRKIFTHLRVDEDLAKICKWDVGKIILTQIGKSAPPHEEFTKEVGRICPKATPAYDGMELLI